MKKNNQAQATAAKGPWEIILDRGILMAIIPPLILWRRAVNERGNRFGAPTAGLTVSHKV